MGELIRQRAQFVLDQPVLQGAQPGGIDQRFGEVFVHLAVPAGQKLQRALAQAFGRALGGGFAGEPQVLADQRQQRPRGEADGVQLRLDETVAGVYLARLHQALPAVHPLRVPPEETDVVGEGAVDQLVVGIAQDAAHGRPEFRVLGVWQIALPAVLGQPALCRHPPLRGMRRIARRDPADHLHGDGVAVHQCQVLAGGGVLLHHGQRLGDIGGGHQPDAGGQAAVFGVERGPGHRRHMARRRDGRQVVIVARQHGAVFRPAQGHGDRVAVLDPHDGAAAFEFLEALGRLVFVRVRRVQRLDMHVLIVQVRRCQPPAQPFRSPRQHRGDAGDRAADHPAGLQFKPRQIPDRRGREAEVRIIGQQRPPRGRA